MEEPSILDYLKAKLTPWKRSEISFPGIGPAYQPSKEEENHQEGEKENPENYELDSSTESVAQISTEVEKTQTPIKLVKPGFFPWRSLLALFLALIAQLSFWPSPVRGWALGAIFLVISIGLLIWAIVRKEWVLAPPLEQNTRIDGSTVNLSYLLVGLLLSIVAFLSFTGLQINILNLSLLLSALIFTILAFWIPGSNSEEIQQGDQKLKNQERGRSFSPVINLSTILILLGIVWVSFFRFYKLSEVPPEMNSDHAEKILDIMRVLAGQTNIFFSGNGGREALIFYLNAALHYFFHFPLGFTSLKLVSATIGFLALPFLYLCGKELGNQRIGILAFLFAGIAYWPNVVSRFGLRLPFYILFTSIILYLILRGIRTSQRNYFTLAGVVLGLSLYGYSADRILPLLILLAVGLYLLHPHSKGRRHFVLVAIVALVVVSLVVFVPMLRYILTESNSFLYRTLTRMGDLERPLPGPAWQIFLNNLGRALTMVSWDGGEIWPISVPHYPALSVVTGALFFLGAASLFIRYLKKRHWLDLFLLLSIPALMLPSTLSLAFPAENPNLYRTGGTLVPIFLIIGLTLDGLMTSLSSWISSPWGKRFSWATVLLLFCWSSLQDYDLVFNKYFTQYQRSAWNSSEMGDVVHSFATTIENPDTAWVVGFPHWVDTRLVAINAGFPGKDYEIFVDELVKTQSEPRAKMFLLNPSDESALSELEKLYPEGWIQHYKSLVETKDFLIYFVPPQDDN